MRVSSGGETGREKLLSMIVKEVHAKSILSRSGIERVSYTINPYTGCSHGCLYCYATFMKKYTGHAEVWGAFVDVKVNAAQLLRRQLPRSAKGNIIVSSVTDPYQRIEARFGLTRACLTVLRDYDFPVEVLTKSPLVLRDADLMADFPDLEVGLTITTDDDRISRIFEPGAPPVRARIQALRKLHEKGLRTFVFIGPALPMRPEVLADMVGPYAHRVMIDRMNYPFKTRSVYKAHGLTRWLDAAHVGEVIEALERRLAHLAVEVC